jgi:Mg2+ and Co2+ transporter CorA
MSVYDNIMNVLDNVTKERDKLKEQLEQANNYGRACAQKYDALVERVNELEKKIYGIKRFLFALLDSPGVPERANKAISKAIHDLARTSEEA